MGAVRVCTFVVAAVAVAVSGRVAAQQPQEPLFRSGTQTVPVYATVLDTADSRLVTGLTRADFDVLDNGRHQPLTVFDNGEQPISIVIMLDLSGSMLGNLPTLRHAAVEMFTELRPGDKARVGGFGNRIVLSERFTNDQNELIRALWFDLVPGGDTPLWGAVNVAMTALAHLDGRRVVLVLSDGKDTAAGYGHPAVTLNAVGDRSQAEDFMVYAIGLASRSSSAGPGYGGGGYGGGYGGYGGGYGRGRPGGGGRGSSGDEPDPGLKVLAMESGGGYFELHDTDALGPTFERIANELHHQYLLGYAVPERDGKQHAIEVRVNKPGLTVRARKSYLAPRPGH
jgi:Ca-activated chloride channel family protein